MAANNSDSRGASVARLLVGGVLRTAAELSLRARVWDAELFVEEPPDARSAGATLVLRWVVIGAIFDSPRRWNRIVMPWAQRQGARLRWGLNHLNRFAPGRRLLHKLELIRISSQIEFRRLESIGRREEQRSLALANRAIRELTAETLDSVGQASQIREVVLEQSASLTAETAAQLRERAAEADSAVERLVRSLLRRRTPRPPRVEPRRLPWPRAAHP